MEAATTHPTNLSTLGGKDLSKNSRNPVIVQPHHVGEAVLREGNVNCDFFYHGILFGGREAIVSPIRKDDAITFPGRIFAFVFLVANPKSSGLVTENCLLQFYDASDLHCLLPFVLATLAGLEPVLDPKSDGPVLVHLHYSVICDAPRRIRTSNEALEEPDFVQLNYRRVV